MNVEKMKKAITHKKTIKIVLSCILILCIILYLRAFFTKGVYFDNIFLEKKIVGLENHYIGTSPQGIIEIIVDESEKEKGYINVIYKLPNNITRKYALYFKKDRDNNIIQTIKNDDGDNVFEGNYKTGGIVLYDKTGKPLFNDIKINISIDGNDYQEKYTEDYRISLINVTRFAYKEKETIRGNFEYLMIAVILGIFTIIDIKRPLLFFNLRYFLSVSNPEPSELYITLQKIGWIVYPIIILGFIIAGI